MFYAQSTNAAISGRHGDQILNGMRSRHVRVRAKDQNSRLKHGLPGESYREELRSSLLYSCYVFRALINSPWVLFRLTDVIDPDGITAESLQRCSVILHEDVSLYNTASVLATRLESLNQ